MSGLETLPGELSKDKNIQTYVTPTNSAVMAFFNNSRPGLNDAKVREALVSAIDTKEVVGLVKGSAGTLKSPLLASHIGFDPTIMQLPYNKA